MATASSFAALDWLIREFAPPRLRAIGLDADAATLENLNPIDRAARLVSINNALLAEEAAVVATYAEAWDAHWQEALDTVFDGFVNGLVNRFGATRLRDMIEDTDIRVKTGLKVLLRVVEMKYCRNLAAG